jgi:hypothetical protein
MNLLTPQYLNTAGLALGMLGVLVIFIWGPPQPAFEDSVGVALDSATVLNDGTRVADIEEQNRRLRRRHRFMSSVGLVLVFFGFALQLWAIWA